MSDMHQAEVLAIVTSIARRELERDDVVLCRGQELADIEGWDSIIMSAVLVGIERRFGIEFTPAEIDGMTTVGSLVGAVERSAGEV